MFAETLGYIASMTRDNPKGLRRNLTNYGDRGFALYLRRSFARSMGYSLEMLDRPIVGIAQTASGFNNCHRTMPELVEAVKRGVLAAGALPLEFPTISLGEIFLSPTSLMFRNLMAMDTEEMIRAQPMDAAVLIGGCDKTVPAQLMGAASADLPAVQLVTGPMLANPWHGERLGACTDCRRYWAKYRAGDVDDARHRRSRRQPGHYRRHLCGDGYGQHHGLPRRSTGDGAQGQRCDPGRACRPPAHGRGERQARGADGAGGGPKPSEIITAKSVENALRVLLAIGGSTNAVIHLAAVAGRCGVAVST